MSIEEIIEEAASFLKDDEPDEAIDLLLDEGYVSRLEPKIQEAYLKMFPESPELTKERNGSLKDLFDANPDKRIKAAKHIHSEALKANHRKIEAWQKDPRTIDTLFKALDDSEPKVVEEVTGALGAIARRYFADLRIGHRLLELLNSSDNPEVVFYAALHLNTFKIPEKWDALINLLKKNPLQKTALAILGNINRLAKLTEKQKADLKSSLTEILSSVKNSKVKQEIETKIGLMDKF